MSSCLKACLRLGTAFILTQAAVLNAEAQDTFDLLFGSGFEAIDVGESAQAGQDDLVIVELKLRNLILSRDLEAYNSAAGLCVNPATVLKALEFAVEETETSLHGWMIEKSRSYHFDYDEQTLSLQGKAVELPAQALQKSPTGWCLTQAGFETLLPAKFDYDPSNLQIILTPTETIPVEARLERAALRNSLLSQADVNDPDYPVVSNPYRWLSIPSADIGLNMRLDKDSQSQDVSIDVAGDFLKTTAHLRTVGSQSKMIDGVRLSLTRKNGFEGGLGSIPVTDLRLGDIYAPAFQLLSRAKSGRGIHVTNRPLFTASTFDTFDIRGPLPKGWEAELYQGETLLAFVTDPDSQGQYIFEDVAISSGYNRFTVKLYGPNGQTDERVIKKLVGQDLIPENEFHYTLGVIQEGIAVFGDDLSASPDVEDIDTLPGSSQTEPNISAYASVEYGVNQQLSVRLDGILDAPNPSVLPDSDTTYRPMAGLAIYGSAFDNYGFVRVASDGYGQPAVQAAVQRRLGSGANASINFTNFGGLETPLSGFGDSRLAQTASLRLQMPLKIGSKNLSTQSRFQFEQSRSGSHRLDISNRVSSTLGAYRVSHVTSYSQTQNSVNTKESNLLGNVLLSRSLAGFRMKANVNYAVTGGLSVREATLTGQRKFANNNTFQSSITYAPQTKDLNFDVSYAKSFRRFTASTYAGVSGDGDWRMGAQLAFSLFVADRKLKMARPGLARSGAILAHVYDDLDDDGVYSAADIPVKGAEFIVANTLRSEQTDDNGQVVYSGVEPHNKIGVSLKQSSLADPFLRPLSVGQATSIRPGQIVTLSYPLTVSAEVDGVVATDNGTAISPVSGVRIQALDKSATVIAESVSEYDGYYYFGDLPAAQMTLRIHPEDLSRVSGECQPLPVNLSRDNPTAIGKNFTISIKTRD